MAKTKMTYKKALGELENIFSDLQDGKIEVDELETKLKSALEYIKVCKDILNGQETKVKDIIAEIEKEG
jgi:exodeoxyribonuclease VII small subunit